MSDPNIPAQQQSIKPLIERVVAQDFNRFIQDMEAQMREFEYFLAGQRIVKDENGNAVLLTESKPRVNTIGRQEIMARLRGFLNQNTWMSQITPEDTEHNFMIESGAIHRMLAENHVKYELTLANARIIADIMTSLFFHAMRKAETDKQTIYKTMSSDSNMVAYPTGPMNPGQGILR